MKNYYNLISKVDGPQLRTPQEFIDSYYKNQQAIVHLMYEDFIEYFNKKHFEGNTLSWSFFESDDLYNLVLYVKPLLEENGFYVEDGHTDDEYHSEHYYKISVNLSN